VAYTAPPPASGGGGGSTNPTAPAPAVAPPSNLRVLAPFSTNAFVPVPGYYAWWNPDTLNGPNNTAVSNWVDSSANGFIAGQSSPTNQPLVEIQAQNGHNIVYFANITNFLTCPSFSFNGSTPLEIFLVFNEVNSGGLSFTYFLGDASYCPIPYYMVDAHGYGGMDFGISSGSGVVGGTSDSMQIWIEMTGLWNGSSSQTWTNGVSAGTGTVASPGAMKGLELGGRCGNPGVDCYIGDIIIYTNVLSTANQQAIENGLRAKYGF
jgi:hypothetical protein